MGNAKIWYWPDPTGTVEKIDFGEPISDLQPTVAPIEAIAEGLTGSLASTTFRRQMRVRVVHERFTSASLARDLIALEDHLKRGGRVALAADSAKAWSGYFETIPARNEASSNIVVFGFDYDENGSITLSAGEEIELLSSQPIAHRELVTCSNAVTNSLTYAEGPRFNYLESGVRWVLARHRDFFPALRLAKDQRDRELITHDHRISYTFDAVLEEDVGILEAFALIPEATIETTGDGNGNATGTYISPEEIGIYMNGGTLGEPGGPGGSVVPNDLPGLDGLGLGGGFGNEGIS